MNKLREKWYLGDSRYEKVLEQMQLLGIQDITTDRQHKNGTIVWKLPIKDQDSGILIEVASFASGYVRNQGRSTHSNYQLNKCEPNVEYWPDHEWKTLDNGDYTQVKTGKFNKFVTKKRILIPIEIDRLEYLISYCLKNYYIKLANQVANGGFIPKWKYDNLADAARLDYENKNDEVADFRRDLQNKLDTIKRIADYE